jgi:hypothetical protein
MEVGFTTTYAISAYHNWSCEFEPRSWRDVLDTTLCDQVCQLLATGRWFTLGTLVSSANKTGSHDITEIFLKVALNTRNQPKTNHIHVLLKDRYSTSCSRDFLVVKLGRTVFLGNLAYCAYTSWWTWFASRISFQDGSLFSCASFFRCLADDITYQPPIFCAEDLALS